MINRWPTFFQSMYENFIKTKQFPRSKRSLKLFFGTSITQFWISRNSIARRPKMFCQIGATFSKKISPKCSNEHLECSFDNHVKKFPTEKRWKIQNSLFSKTVKKVFPSRAISPLKNLIDTQNAVLTTLLENFDRRLEIFAHCPKMTKKNSFL